MHDAPEPSDAPRERSDTDRAADAAVPPPRRPGEPEAADAAPPPPRRPGEAQRGLLGWFARLRTGPGVAMGLVLTLLLHVAAAIVFGIPLSLIGSTSGGGFAVFPLLFIGVAQLVYVIPAWIALRRAGARPAALGLVIGASVTFLLNGTCLVAVMYSLSNLH